MDDVKSVLIVEDDEIISNYIKSALLSSGYNVAGVESTGLGAIESATELKPDLILMDIVLDGGVNGIQAAARIKSKLNIPVVFVTSLSDKDTINKANQTNPYGYIVKPFRPEELLYTINIALNQFSSKYGIVPLAKSSKYLFNENLNGIITSDRRAIVSSLNSVAEKITGFTNQEAFGMNLGDVLKIVYETHDEQKEYKVDEIIKDPGFSTIDDIYKVRVKNGSVKEVGLFAYIQNYSWAKKQNIAIMFDFVENLSIKVNQQNKSKILLNTSKYFGESTRFYLKDQNSFEILDDPLNMSHFIEKLRIDKPDVVIIDNALYAEKADFLWNLKFITKEFPNIKILVYYHQIKTQLIVKTLSAGAHGIIHLQSAPEELLAALHTIVYGNLWIDSFLLGNFADGFELKDTSLQAKLASLTNREQQIFDLLLEGFSNKKISEVLSISVNTVKNTLSNIYEKLDVNGRKDILSTYRSNLR